MGTFEKITQPHIASQSLLWADLGLPSISVRVCVLTGIELWIYWTDFKADLIIVYCYGLVVIS